MLLEDKVYKGTVKANIESISTARFMQRDDSVAERIVTVRDHAILPQIELPHNEQVGLRKKPTLCQESREPRFTRCCWPALSQRSTHGGRHNHANVAGTAVFKK